MIRIAFCTLLALFASEAYAKPQTVSYGSSPKQTMDIYLPANPANAPILFMVHGGGWKSGDKSMRVVYQNKADYWVPKGYIFISANYRLLPETGPVDQGKDIATAVNYVQSHATEWGGDARRIVLMGHSAGAHLVALVGAQPSVLNQPVRGVVPLDGAAYDVELLMQPPREKVYDRAWGGDPSVWREGSPYAQLEAGMPPFFLVCSSQRPVSCPQATRLADRINEMGGQAAVLTQNLAHMEISGKLGENNAYTEAVNQFIARVAQP